MKTKNKELMSQARSALRGHWKLTILTFCVMYIFAAAVGFIPRLGNIVSIIIGGPVAFGIALFSLKLVRKENPEFEDVFKGFNHFLVSLKASLLMTLYVFLWLLLLIIPGIIKGIAYSMTFFILADDPTIGARAALKKSQTMMNGYKWKYFCLNLRFLGWALLCLLTLGIGFLWLIPYIQISLAAFYEDIKDDTRGETPHMEKENTPTPTSETETSV